MNSYFQRSHNLFRKSILFYEMGDSDSRISRRLVMKVCGDGTCPMPAFVFCFSSGTLYQISDTSAS